MRYFIILLAALLPQYITTQERFTLSIIHINDFHARFEETNVEANACKEDEECIGGYARVVTKVKELLSTRENPLYLNAGDNFSGTLWYNLGRWNVTNEFLNMLPADVQTLGNHEFDHGIDGVLPYLKNTLTPIVVSNIDDSEQPNFRELNIKKSIVIEKYARKIGVIGVLLRRTSSMARTENLKFLDEVESVRDEAQRLKDEQGVDIVIVLAHCELPDDRRIAEFGGPNIDIIVGGHSHSLLWNGPDAPPVGNVIDSYPIVVEQANGHKVLIVQASAYARYVGDIQLHFDENGVVQAWEGHPHFLGSDVPQDAKVLEALKPWKEMIDEIGQEVIGNIKFDVSRAGCFRRDCLMGSLQADSMIYGGFEQEVVENGAWAYATIALTNPGGVRAGLTAGSITYADLVTTTPFENTADKIEIQGKYLRETFEKAVANASSYTVLQTSGIRVVYNMSKPVNSRVHILQGLCRFCDVPHYVDIEDDSWYRVLVNSFLLLIDDDFPMLRENMQNHTIGSMDIDALRQYVKANSPMTMMPPYGRVTFVN